MWWNVIGFVGSVLVPGLVALTTRTAQVSAGLESESASTRSADMSWRMVYVLVALYLFVIIAVCLWAQTRTAGLVAAN